MEPTTKRPSFFQLMKETFNEFMDDNGTKLSASLSYYTIFSIGPLLLLIISLTGLFVDKETVASTINGQVQSLLGAQAADQIIEITASLQKQNEGARIGSIISAITLFLGATGVFLEIQDSINYIWGIKAKPKKGWLRLITNRLLSFSLIIGMGFLLVVSLLINTLADLLTGRLARLFGEGQVILVQGVGLVILFLIITLLFAIIYKVLPDAKIHWRDAVAGASFTGILFLIGKFLIGFYLGNSKLGLTYGAAASVIIILLWVYYSAIILYFGAEFTKVYAFKIGHGLVPNRTAVVIEKRKERELPKVREIVSEHPADESAAPAKPTDI
jgi:membrane protein